MLFTIRAWNNKKKEFFFTDREIKDYLKSQNIPVSKHLSEEISKLDKKYLEQRNIILTGHNLKDLESICNVIFQIVEKNVLNKLNVKKPENYLISCSNMYNYYSLIEGFYQLIDIILKQKSVTDHIEPTEHYVLFIMDHSNSNPDLKNIDKMKSFQIPTKYQSSLLYCIYSHILGDFVKIEDQERYNNLFVKNKKITYLSKINPTEKTAIIKGNCFNSEKLVLEIDKILFILEYIDNEINAYLETLEVNPVVKKYLFTICKVAYYDMCAVFLSLYISKNASMAKYKSLSDIKYKS